MRGFWRGTARRRFAGGCQDAGIGAFQESLDRRRHRLGYRAAGGKKPGQLGHGKGHGGAYPGIRQPQLAARLGDGRGAHDGFQLFAVQGLDRSRAAPPGLGQLIEPRLMEPLKIP